MIKHRYKIKFDHWCDNDQMLEKHLYELYLKYVNYSIIKAVMYVDYYVE